MEKLLNLLLFKLKSIVDQDKGYKVCPKTGKETIISDKKRFTWRHLFLPAIGVISLIWVLIRVIPKPSRINYPCVRAAAPFAASLVGWIINLAGITLFYKKSLKYFKAHKYALGSMCLLLVMITSLVLYSNSARDISAAADVNNGSNTGTFTPSDSPNSPIGTAKGINPGRVSWAYDPTAATWDGSSNYWYSDKFNNQKSITGMLDNTIKSISNKATVSEAWDSLFKFYNSNNGQSNVGYTKGEKIAIKINLNNNFTGNKIDASPHTVYAVLDHLINVVGVKQSDIVVFDAQRTNITPVKTRCQSSFPEVQYNNWGSWVSNKISYSKTVSNNNANKIPSAVNEAKYYINLAILKRHTQPTTSWTTTYGNTGVTLCGKNNFGTMGNVSTFHFDVRDWNESMGSYSPIVDIIGSKNVGKKTMLYLVDGLYAGDRYDAVPKRWKSEPFNNKWPSSLFASQDPIAIDSVCLDFLRNEWSLTANADNYLHEAALANNSPSKISYKPDGVALQSLGVHEHWDNNKNKNYSKNLGKGNGIELVRADGTQPTTTPTTKPTDKPTNTPITTPNKTLYGDVSGNGVVDSADYTLLRKYLLGIITELPASDWRTVSDLNSDRAIDSADFTLLRKFLLHIITKLPV